MGQVRGRSPTRAACPEPAPISLLEYQFALALVGAFLAGFLVAALLGLRHARKLEADMLLAEAEWESKHKRTALKLKKKLQKEKEEARCAKESEWKKKLEQQVAVAKTLNEAADKKKPKAKKGTKKKKRKANAAAAPTAGGPKSPKLPDLGQSSGGGTNQAKGLRRAQSIARLKKMMEASAERMGEAGVQQSPAARNLKKRGKKKRRNTITDISDADRAKMKQRRDSAKRKRAKRRATMAANGTAERTATREML